MKVDRSRFLTLTASLGVVTASCGAQEHPPVRVEVPPEAKPITIAPVDAAASPVVYRDPEPPPPEPPPACAENATGSLAACDAWKVDPTCESGGPRSECTTLVDSRSGGFKPKVAQKIAECMASKPVTRATGCKRPDMHKCIRAGVDIVCVEPEMTDACEKLTDACKRRGAKPTFTVEQCAKIASAQTGSMRDWALQVMGGRHGDGTPMAEGCTLEYAAIYNPWPKNWWTGK